jgi:hypothetical protein
MKKIKLQYTIDENELAPETARILGKSISRLTSIVASVPDMGSLMTVNTINEISGLRQELASIDVMLDDVHAIIDGYVQYQQEQHQLRQSATPEELAAQQVPDVSSFDPSTLTPEQAQDLLARFANLEGDVASEPEIQNIMPPLKTQKQVEQHQGTEGTEIDVDRIKTVSQQIQELTSQQDPAKMTPEYAHRMLSEINDIDLTDVRNLGTKLESLKNKLQENEFPD